MEVRDQIFAGDCIEIMRTIPDGTFQCTFADPPFNLGKNYATSCDTLPEAEYLAWCQQWIAELVRITRDDGSIIIHNIPKWCIPFGQILTDAGASFRAWIAWDAPTAPMPKPLEPHHYGILYYCKTPKLHKFYRVRQPHPRCRCGLMIKDYGGRKTQMHPFGPSCGDIWNDIGRIKWEVRRDDHPCQLPVPLVERLILMTTDAGDCVFDPFMGTGTTAIACKRLGRRWCGSELNPEFRSIALKNVASENFVSRLGQTWVGYYFTDDPRIITIRECDWEALKPYFAVPADLRSIDRHVLTFGTTRGGGLNDFLKK